MTADNVEQMLKTCFLLAHKWGCVFLLDEADVFLAERAETDLARNALVSGGSIISDTTKFILVANTC